MRIHAQTKFEDPQTYNEEPPHPTKIYLTADAFKHYMKKFDAVDVFANVDKLQRTRSNNFTLTEYTDLIFQGLDASAALLELKVKNGNPKVLAVSSRRQYHLITQTWTPPPGMSVYPKDRFSYKDRLYELMKQAIYQSRNKMVIMQLMREKYRDTTLYRMGYLMGKTDTACKIFSKVSYHAWRHCYRVRNEFDTYGIYGPLYFKFNIYDIMHTHMRMLHLWFQAELLTDLVIRNDVQFHAAYAIRGRWNFTD